MPDIDGRPLRFCSNVTETEDGTIYFTESTSSFHYEHFRAAILGPAGTADCTHWRPTAR